jgi:hypothetical protein
MVELTRLDRSTAPGWRTSVLTREPRRVNSKHGGNFKLRLSLTLSAAALLIFDFTLIVDSLVIVDW